MLYTIRDIIFSRFIYDHLYDITLSHTLHRILITLLFSQIQEGNRTTDLEFTYDDTDVHASEISELYSYTEQYELQLNLKVKKKNSSFNNGFIESKAILI